MCRRRMAAERMHYHLVSILFPQIQDRQSKTGMLALSHADICGGAIVMFVDGSYQLRESQGRLTRPMLKYCIFGSVLIGCNSTCTVPEGVSAKAFKVILSVTLFHSSAETKALSACSGYHTCIVGKGTTAMIWTFAMGFVESPLTVMLLGSPLTSNGKACLEATITCAVSSSAAVTDASIPPCGRFCQHDPYHLSIYRASH